MTSLQEEFIDIVNKEIHRTGINELLEWLNNSDFFYAPASTRFHESYEGGLCEHSINVYKHLLLLDESYKTNFNPESMAIVSLFHDLCKVNCYEISERNVKGKDGAWRKEPFYKWNEQNKYGGHGSKSVYIIQFYIKLYFDEATAINCHMGIENGNCSLILDAYRDNPLAFLLHTADMASTVDALNEKIGIASGGTSA